MRLLDTNVLFNAVYDRSPHHRVAQQALQQAFSDNAGVALAWLPLIGFIRVATRSGIMPRPLAVADALALVHEWLQHPRAQLLQPGVRHLDLVSRLLLEAGVAGNLTNDAHIAALAIEQGAEVLTFDKDFAKFTGLRYQLLS